MKKILIATLVGSLFSLNTFANENLDQYFSHLAKEYESGDSDCFSCMANGKNKMKLSCSFVSSPCYDENGAVQSCGIAFNEAKLRVSGPIITLEIDGEDGYLIHEDRNERCAKILKSDGDIFGYAKALEHEDKHSILIQLIEKDEEGKEKVVGYAGCAAV